MKYRAVHISNMQNRTPSVQTRGDFIFDYVLIVLKIIRILGLFFLGIKLVEF
jgi:hypothetical protein